MEEKKTHVMVAGKCKKKLTRIFQCKLIALT